MDVFTAFVAASVSWHIVNAQEMFIAVIILTSIITKIEYERLVWTFISWDNIYSESLLFCLFGFLVVEIYFKAVSVLPLAKTRS